MVQNNFFYIARSEFWPYFLKSKNAETLLKKNMKSSQKWIIFNEYVQEIGIETSAFCNRKCVYCPVSEYPRKQQFMDDQLYKKILEEMRQIDYKGIFTLSLFNEPLASKDILNRIRLIKQYCPCSYVRMNSNGDYLTKDLLDELNEAGLNEILITQHMDVNETYSDEIAQEKIDAFFKRIGLTYTITKMKDMHNISCDLMYKKIKLLVVTNNWEEDGTDRGGKIEFLSGKKRNQPCCTPFRELYIDVNGFVRFCFNIFVNEKNLGNVANHKVVDLFFSEEMVDIRRSHLNFGPKEWPCETCNTPDNALLESYEIREALLKKSINNN
ncbi:radical SAM/SPASM domain-containing protein [Clostridiaceae bacterium]|nr:radical SAM/SPASM domain-containing protein [Clostridiaceae bacterium]